MATGFMMQTRFGKRLRHLVLPALLSLSAWPLLAQDVGLAGIAGNKALLMINGAAPRSVVQGGSLDGVKVLSVEGDRAVIELDGRQRALRIGQHAVGTGGGGAQQILLKADSQGHFVTTGTINGVSVRFLVDTGATMISLGASDARRIGIDLRQAAKGLSQTANGQVVVSKVQLDNVRIDGITLHQVDALVHPQDMPVALLGMSYLNRMEMQRDGSTMVLKRRF